MAKKTMSVKDFKDYNFENCDVPEKYWGDYPHANFFKGEFIPVARREMRAMAKRLGAELKFSPMYFEYSCFFKKGDKFVYVNVGDVRYNVCGHWYENVLYRTAESYEDYHGGCNNNCPYDELEENIKRLLD